MRRNLWQQGMGLLVVLLALARPAGAQTGLIAGRVVDTAALPVPGAEVRVVAGSGESRVAISDGAGEWSMRFADPSDRFAVTVRAVGFAPARFVVAGTAQGVAVADVQLAPVIVMGVVTAQRRLGPRAAP